MADTRTNTAWNAYIVYEDGDEALAGQLSVDAGMLSIASAVDEENREYLQAAVDSVNAVPELYQQVAPELDEPRYTLKAKVFTRSDPGFEEALAETLLSDHDLRVEPAN